MEKDSKSNIQIDKTVNQILSEKQVPMPLPFVKGKLYIFDDNVQLETSVLLNVSQSGMMVIGRKRTAIFAPVQLTQLAALGGNKFRIVKSGQVLMYLGYEVDTALKTIRYKFLHEESIIQIDHVAAMQYFNV